MSKYFFVQRMERRDNEHKKGLDSKFSLEYMGSSEFESGAVQNSLKRMRTAPVTAQAVDVTYNGELRTVWFVAAGNHQDHGRDMTEWLSQESPRSMEITWFPETLNGYRDTHTNAWWDLEYDVAFTLDESHAHDLAAAINGPKDA